MAGKRDFFDFDNPIYKPWVKALILILCFGWGLFELIAGSPFWAVIFLALGAYCAWGFFLRKSGGE